MFQAPAPQPGPPLASLPGNNGPGEFTRMMSTPSAPAESLFKPPSVNDAGLFAQSPGGAPPSDEFSRVAGAPRPDAPARSAPKPAPAPPAKANSSVLPLLLTVGGLLVVAVILVVIFAK